MKTKARIHNEWFQPLSDKRKTCPYCHVAVTSGLYAWGEYVYGKWRTVRHFCQECFPLIQKSLQDHAMKCRCEIEYCARSGHSMPEWFYEATSRKIKE